MKLFFAFAALFVAGNAFAGEVCMDLEKPIACSCTEYRSYGRGDEDPAPDFTLTMKFMTASGKIVSKNTGKEDTGSCWAMKTELEKRGYCPSARVVR